MSFNRNLYARGGLKWFFNRRYFWRASLRFTLLLKFSMTVITISSSDSPLDEFVWAPVLILTLFSILNDCQFHAKYLMTQSSFRYLQYIYCGRISSWQKKCLMCLVPVFRFLCSYFSAFVLNKDQKNSKYRHFLRNVFAIISIATSFPLLIFFCIHSLYLKRQQKHYFKDLNNYTSS